MVVAVVVVLNALIIHVVLRPVMGGDVCTRTVWATYVCTIYVLIWTSVFTFDMHIKAYADDDGAFD